MPYNLEQEIRQCEEDSVDDGASLYPVFCTVELSTEDIKSLILATHVDTDVWKSQYVFLDTLNSNPAVLPTITHVIRHPSPPLMSPFSASWTPRDFHNYFNLHLRNKPDKSGREAGNFTNFAFLIVTPRTLSEPSEPVIVCSDAPDYYESPDDPPVLKTQGMPFIEAVMNFDAYEYCVGCISEYGEDSVMSQQPPAIMADIEYVSGGMRGKIASGAQMRENRFIAIRKWEELQNKEGKEDDCRARVERVTYKDE